MKLDQVNWSVTAQGLDIRLTQQNLLRASTTCSLADPSNKDRVIDSDHKLGKNFMQKLYCKFQMEIKGRKMLEITRCILDE